MSFAERKHGGKRKGAGRPKKPGSGVSHLRRAKLSRHHPVHVTWRVSKQLPSLRRPRLMRVLERGFDKGCQRFGMRLVHYSVQRSHIHLICEATDARALSRGLQGLGIRLAKALNRALGRKGSVFADRYHCRVLKTPREVRNVLAYVLGSAYGSSPDGSSRDRRHASERGARRPSGWLDRCSSARFFDGYRQRDMALVVDAWMDERLPVAPASCWLLTTGWRRCGLLCIDALPGARRRR
jgi:REP element-mobilizing transposase RayT